MKLESRSGDVVPAEPPAPGTITARQRLMLFMDGTLKPEDLLDDEVLRGQIIGKNMKFSGRGDAMIPRKMMGIITRELRYRMEQKFAAHVDEAIDTIVDVMRVGEGEQTSVHQKAGTKRLQAAIHIVDRVIGPIQKDVNVTVEQTPWQAAVESGDLIIDIEDPDVVIDAEIIDEEAPRRARGRRGA